ncbi:MAG TPA: aminodeoxychorismate synthase component I [Bacteroidetes bacterium]|nr:aminodeoxychorismate synthase component I [Bacteroidota bacterium]
MNSYVINMESREELIDIVRGNGDQNPLIFLDSQLPEHPSNKNSWLFNGFERILTYKNGIATQIDGSGNKVSSVKLDPWEALTTFRKEYPGYHCGYFGYDLKNYSEELISRNADVIGMPEFWIGRASKIYCYSVGDGEELKKVQSNRVIENESKPSFRVDFKKIISKQEYLDKIKAAQKLIHDGDIYEVNLSHQIEAEFEGSPVDLYQSMYHRGPVPYAAYLNLGDIVVCCASPERFLKKNGKNLISDPIKGTRPRGENEISDSRIKKELFESEKDKAENLMIVDLVRNDLSRVSKQGSVRVTSLFDVQSFGTVHQLVSRVESEISDNVTQEQAISNCFPMGSMTGAPKIRAMEVIDELENYHRGIYSGAIGFFDPAGDFNFNVVIRSAIIKKNNLWYSAGGAITSDSEPNQEWIETLVKIRALGLDLSEFE